MKIHWLYLMAVGTPLYVYLDQAEISAAGLNIPPLWFQLVPLAIMILGEGLIGRSQN